MVNKSKEGDQSWIREIVNGDTDEGRRVMIQRHGYIAQKYSLGIPMD